MRRITIQILLLLMSFGTLKAQSDPCVTRLTDAGTMIEDGRYDEAIELLNTAIQECDYSKDFEIEARKALIIAYLEIDDLEKAELSAAEIMRISPNYKPDPIRDTPEMIALFKKYKPTAVFTIGLKGGANISLIETIKTYSIVSDDDSPGLDNYKSKTGFQVGIYGEYRAWKELWIQLDAMFRQSGYSIDIPNVEGRTIFYDEDLTYFDFGLSAKYYFLKQDFKPYAQLGVSYSALNSALGNLSRDDISDIVDRKIQRNENLFGVFGEIGASYAFGNITIGLGARYTYIDQQVNKEGTRYENLPSVFQYYYVDNDFRMDNVQFLLSAHYNLFFKNVAAK